jgi:diadenosine tetraphosphatase ApaH/serine/threonine PP2A family protein phosphatase
MLVALLSDIHSNFQALETVMGEIDSRGVDEIYCLGDIVGYGADPAKCLEIVQKRCTGVVLGNHDLAVATEFGLNFLPPDGKKAAQHNRSALPEKQINYLAKLPLSIETESFTLVHASPQHPDRWQRLGSFYSSQAQFKHFSTEICFLGHTHSPSVVSDQIGISRVRPGHRFLINVGSVGQPRDGDPRACAALFNTSSFEYELLRIPYDIGAAQSRIHEEDLPPRLAERLQFGR